MLGYTSVKDLTITKIVEQITSERVWGKLDSKQSFPIQSFTKYFRPIVVSKWNSALPQKFNFCFSKDFYWYQQNSHFGRKAGQQVIILWGLDTFSGFSNFLIS